MTEPRSHRDPERPERSDEAERPEIRALRALGRAEAPPELWERVQAELRRTQREAPRPVLRPVFRRLAVAAALLLLVGGSAWLLRPGTLGSGSVAPSETLVLAPPTPPEVKEALLAKVQVRRYPSAFGSVQR